VFVVDDDDSVRRSLSRLLRSAGHQVETFGSAGEFTARTPRREAGPRCVVLDVELPGSSGLALHRELSDRPDPVPVVFITGHGDIPMGVQAMKEGAVDFLPKPFEAEDLLDAVDRALERDVTERGRRRRTKEAEARLADLTPREHEVMRHVIAGLLNKQIALKLGISEKTVKVHRGRVMEKMGVSSVAELVRIAERAGVRPAGGD
jgi:FixJ family two-component response regulator